MDEAHRQLLEWQSQIIQTTGDDLLRNGAIAEHILTILAELRGQSDRSAVLEAGEEIHSEWVRTSASQVVTTRLVRQMSLFTIPQPRLRTYLYASQYLFLGESYFRFCVDLTRFLCDAMRGGEARWGVFREQSERESLFAKLNQLERDGIDCFSEMYDRRLRNSLAHGKFEITREGMFKCWMRADRTDLRELTIDDLVRTFDRISDVTMIVSLLFPRCMVPEFLAGV